MLSDFDLAKQSGHPGGRPATILQFEPNGVRLFFCLIHDSACDDSHNPPMLQVPMIDTMSCTADFRTNSFVGTEGKASLLTCLSTNNNLIRCG